MRQYLLTLLLCPMLSFAMEENWLLSHKMNRKYDQKKIMAEILSLAQEAEINNEEKEKLQEEVASGNLQTYETYEINATHRKVWSAEKTEALKLLAQSKKRQLMVTTLCLRLLRLKMDDLERENHELKTQLKRTKTK